MTIILAASCFLAGCIAALAVDWLVCTRLAAYRTDFDYDYRPGKFRSALLAGIVAFLVYFVMVNDPSHPWLPGIGVAALAFVAYGQIASRDVAHGLRRSDRD